MPQTPWVRRHDYMPRTNYGPQTDAVAPVVPLINVGLGVDDSYTGTITVTPPGTVYGPFAGGGGGSPICVVVLSYESGTVVTFDASGGTPPSWSSDFVDQVSIGSSDPLVTTINENITPFGASAHPCTVSEVGGSVYFLSFA